MDREFQPQWLPINFEVEDTPDKIFQTEKNSSRQNKEMGMTSRSCSTFYPQSLHILALIDS